MKKRQEHIPVIALYTGILCWLKMFGIYQRLRQEESSSQQAADKIQRQIKRVQEVFHHGILAVTELQQLSRINRDEDSVHLLMLLSAMIVVVLSTFQYLQDQPFR